MRDEPGNVEAPLRDDHATISLAPEAAADAGARVICPVCQQSFARQGQRQ